MLVSALALGMLASGPALARSDKDFAHDVLAKEALEGHIRPGFDGLAKAMGGLKATLEDVCAKRDAKDTARLAEAFKGALLAWSHVEHLRFGPLTEDNRFERIMFWPDRQKIGERQVNQVLEKKDPASLSADELAKRSAAVQGLTALEIVLFPGPAKVLADTPEAKFACGYAVAIAGNLSTMARAIAEQWGPEGAFAKLWTTPGAANPMYKAGINTSVELLKVYRNGLANARDAKLLPALGMKRLRPDGPFAPKSRAPFDLSELSVASIVANIEGVLDLVNNGGMIRPLSIEQPQRADLINDELEAAIKAAKEVEPQGSKVFAEEPANPKLAGLRTQLQAAWRLGGDGLEEAIMGKVIGFVDSDGD